MKLLRILLFPLVPVYYVVTWVRNWLYDKGIFLSKSYDLPIICVGNLSTGGTGKTPMIEYLITKLKAERQLATLSRGYKRKTTGFKIASEGDNALTLGDEPFQLYDKFKHEIIVSVDADRCHGIDQLLQLNDAPDVILLDDAFQHRKVEADLYILLTAYDDLFSKDCVLPTGNLREPKSGMKRAHIIVITKCPDNLKKHDKDDIRQQLGIKPYQTLYFSRIAYAKHLYNEDGEIPLNTIVDFTLVTGIAKPEPLVTYLKGKGFNFKHLKFADHHEFSQQELEALEQEAFILTTEKDYVRLKAHQPLRSKLFYLPIRITIDASEAFMAEVKNVMKH